MTKLINGPDTYQGQGFNIISILIGFKAKIHSKDYMECNIYYTTYNIQTIDYYKTLKGSNITASHRLRFGSRVDLRWMNW